MYSSLHAGVVRFLEFPPRPDQNFYPDCQLCPKTLNDRIVVVRNEISNTTNALKYGRTYTCFKLPQHYRQ